MFQWVNYVCSWLGPISSSVHWIPPSQGLLSRMPPPASASLLFSSSAAFPLACKHVEMFPFSTKKKKKKSLIRIFLQLLLAFFLATAHFSGCFPGKHLRSVDYMIICALSISSLSILSWTYFNQAFIPPTPTNAALIKVIVTSTLPGSVVNSRSSYY